MQSTAIQEVVSAVEACAVSLFRPPWSRPPSTKVGRGQVHVGHTLLFCWGWLLETWANSKAVMEGVNLIDSEPRNMHRKVKEAIHIKLWGATLNRTGGYDLSDLYLPLLREEETRGAGRALTAHISTASTTSSMVVLRRSQAASWRNIGGNFLPEVSELVLKRIYKIISWRS